MTAAVDRRAARQPACSGCFVAAQPGRRTRSSRADSIALGVGLTLCGWVFTGTALIAAQLTASTRSMYGIAGAVIGVAYVLRAVGDVGSARAELALADRVVPGHARLLRPALVAGPAPARRRGGGRAARRTPCSQRRDIGSGVLAARPGPDRAGRRPAAARSAWPGACSAASVIGWAAGLFLMGLAYGSIGDDVGDLVGDSETTQEMFLQGGGRPGRRLLRDLAADAGPDRVRLRDLLGAAAARRGGGRPGRVAAGDRPAPARLAARPRRGDRARASSSCWPLSGLGPRPRLRPRHRRRRRASLRYLLPLLSYVAPVLVLSGRGPAAGRREPAAGRRWPGCRWCWPSW